MKMFFAVITLAAVALAQQPGGQQQGGGQPGGGAGGVTTTPGIGTTPGLGTTTPGRTPGTTTQPNPNDPFGRGQQQQQQFPEMQRPIFLSGKVVLGDGSPPPEPVVIERVCNGQPRPEGYTDSKGRFSFQLGQNTHLMADASVSGASDAWSGIPGAGPSNTNTMGGNNRRGFSERDLMGCELRASLAGYRSEIVNLSGRRMMDNPDVGTIILKRLANVEGLTTSMTTLQAPKDAKKSYDKARDLLKKKKSDEAQKELEKAVQLYPKYAVAWHQLGLIHQDAKRDEDARKAYDQAVAADSRYVNPYLQLALMSAQAQKWQEVADTTNRVIRLNPMDFPTAFYFNSVANYNLQKFEEAESSAREAIKLDSQHRLPKAQHILGILLAMKEDYKGAVENIRGYLKFAPQSQDADVVRKQLTEIEKRLGQTEVTQKQEPQEPKQQQ